MSERPAPLGAFLAELKRRKVHRAALVYAVVAGGVWGAAEVAVPALGLPEGVITAIVIATLVGFPVALVLAWSFEIRLEEPAAAEPEAPVAPVVGHRWGLVAGGIAAVIAVTAGIVILGRPGGLGGDVLQEGATIVLADFTSSEGDEDIALAIRQALRVDVEHAEYVTIVGPGAIQGGLRRMEVPQDAKMTSDIAREIAVRDGYAAVLEGDVVSAGTGWLVTLRLTRPDGESALSDRETLSDEADVLPGVNRLSRRFRERMGESALSLAASPPLPELTTHSLEAIQAIAKAWQFYETGTGSGVPRRYFEEALEADSGFVQARAQLAALMSQDPRELPEAVRLLQEVYPERDRLAPAERVDFLWTYHRVVEGDHEASTRVVRDFLQAYPDRLEDHQWELILDAMTIGDFEAAESLLLELKEHRGGSLIPNMRHNLLFSWVVLGRYDQIDSTAALHPDVDWRMPAHAARFREDWRRIDELMATADLNDFERTVLPMFQALVRGRLDALRRQAAAVDALFREGGEPGRSAMWGLAFPATAGLVLGGDTANAVARATTVAREHPPDRTAVSAYLRLELAEVEALAGRPERARQHLAHFDSISDEHVRQSASLDRRVAEGRVLRAEGRHEEALDLLVWARNTHERPSSDVHLVIAQSYDALSEPDSAVLGYEAFLATHDPLDRFRADRHWRMRYLAVTHERLGQLYEELGRPDDAIRHHQKLVDDWAEADPVLQPRVEAAREALVRLSR
jgi:tetratricopeptide (TPR) repeat protein